MHTIFSKIDKKYKIEYWLLLGMNIISTGILTFNVYLEGILLNSLVYKADRAAFVRSIVLITTLSLIRLLLSYFMNKIQILRFREINMKVNDVIMKELYVKDTLAVTKMNSVQTADRITEDTTEVLTFLFQTINQIISIALSSILIFTYLFMAGSGFLLLIAILLPAYSLIYLFLRPKIFEVSLKLKEAYNKYFSGFTEWLSRYIEVKGNRREKIETERWSNTKRTLLGVAKRDFLLNLNMSNSEIVLQLIFQLVLFINGGLSVISGKMTIGSFSIIFQYFNQLLGQVDEIFSILFKFESFKVAWMRINNILTMKNEQDGRKIISKINLIQVHDFNIYLDEKTPLFTQNFSANFVTPGFYIVRGRNGIGKSTLLRTIIGLYTPKKEGKITINGIDADLINKRKLRESNISCLFQDIPLPNCSVRDYLGSYSDKSQVYKSEYFAKVFDSPQFRIEKILDREMSELSTGEIQLVKLYSAVLKTGAQCFLLDEPLANIYPELQSDLLKLLQEIAQVNLVIIISHDLKLNENTKNIRIE